MTHTIKRIYEQRTIDNIWPSTESCGCLSAVQSWARTLVHGLCTAILIGLTTSSLAQPLEITIYALRSANDLQHKTYTIDSVYDPQSYRDLDINLVQSGSTGQMSSTFIRGTNSNHTLFTLNGMSIKDYSTPTGVDDISQHSLVGVNSVEIIKGPMSTVYGPNAVGGVVNMTSYATEQNWIDLSIGSNGLNTQTVKVGDWIGPMLVDFSANRSSTDGISVSPQGVEPDGFDTENYSLKTTSNINEWWFNTNINSKTNHSDLDNSGSDALDYTSTWRFNNQYIDALNGTTKLSFNRVAHDRTYIKSGVTDTYLSESHNLLGTHVYSFGRNDLTVGAEYMQTQADFDTAIGGYESSVDQTRNNSAVLASYDHMIGTDTVVSIGARQDWLSDFDDVQTYRIGASKNGWRTAYSTAFKEPTAYEQHGTDNWGFQGNPNLKPEHTRTVEIGYANTVIDVAVYKTEIEDLLKYLNNTYTNDTGTSVRQGADVGINYAVNDWKIENTTSYVRAEDSTGLELTRRPKWHNTLNIAYTIDNTQQLQLQHNYYGSHRDINSTTWATEDQPSVSTVDIGYKFHHLGKTVSAGLNNVFDKTYERPNGYNQQGQNFELGIRIEF